MYSEKITTSNNIIVVKNTHVKDFDILIDLPVLSNFVSAKPNEYNKKTQYAT